MPLNRGQGVTLAELLVSLVLLGLVGTVLARSLLQQQRVARRTLSVMEARQTLDQGAAWLSAELAPLGLGDSTADLIRLAPESLTYRAYRSGALACAVTASDVRLLSQTLTGWRLPQPGRDSLLLWTAPDRPGASGAQWAVLPILGIAASTCPAGTALRLATVIDTSRVQLGSLPALAPVRTFEVMQMKLYSSLGAWWIGARSESGGEVIQPLAGPVAPAGIRLSARDSAGAATSVPVLARELEIRLAAGPAAESAWIRLDPWNLHP